MVDNHFRWDFIGLSTDTKPTPATSSKVVDGSTFYCSDTSKLYVFCKDTWYEKTATGGGGTTYTAGDGIDITGGEISVDPTYVATLEELDARINKGAGAPTTATEGVVGGLYEDTTNGKLYICTEVTAGVDPDPDTYTWEEVGAGGGSGAFTMLTSADYNYPVNNPEVISPGLLEPGLYMVADNNTYVMTDNYHMYQKGCVFCVTQVDYRGEKWAIQFNPDGAASAGSSSVTCWVYNPTTGNCYSVSRRPLLDNSWIWDGLDFTYSGARVLDAHQGKVLNDKIESAGDYTSTYDGYNEDALEYTGLMSLRSAGKIDYLLKSMWACTYPTQCIIPKQTPEGGTPDYIDFWYCDEAIFKSDQTIISGGDISNPHNIPTISDYSELQVGESVAIWIVDGLGLPFALSFGNGNDIEVESRTQGYALSCIKHCL